MTSFLPQFRVAAALAATATALSAMAAGPDAGLNNYQPKRDGPRFSLGGFEIVDLVLNQAVFQIPVELWTDSGLPMTQNPFWIEPMSGGLRAYFMPEDEQSTIYVYEVDFK